jgi:fructokinase
VIVIGGEALVDLVDEQGMLRPVAGGGPFNTAIALGRLDVPVAFLGTLSRDDYGLDLARLLGEAGVDTSLVRWSTTPTPLAVVHRHGDANTFTFYLSATALTDLPPEALPQLPEHTWAIHVGTLALAVDPPAGAYEALIEREAGRRIVVLDPNVRPEIFGDPAAYRARFERLVGLADIVKLSQDDAAWLYPTLETTRVLDLLLGLGPQLVAITKGEDGAIAASANGFADVPGIAVEVADTVGAGDSFGAALIAALIDLGAIGPDGNAPLDDSLIAGAVSYAVAASALTCTRTGSVPPSRGEIDGQLSRRRVDHGASAAADGPAEIEV